MSDPGGLPAPGQVGAGSGPERPTRKPLPLWDRVKFLLLLTLLFWFFVWSEFSNPNPFNTFGDALQETVDSKWVLFVLIGVELARQAHYLLAEHSARYYRFWTSIFGRCERRMGRMNDWNRYRVARAAKVLIFLAVASIVIGTLYDVPPTVAFFELPSRVWGWLPMVFQLLFAMVFLIGQFGALFWFLSRGGVDTYMPEEIKTRFTDVWGQDAVLEKVKENMVFLERPEAIEEKGGFVPGGVLLWGPPGTGKGQPVSARVMTPSGARRMGDLLPGDYVIGSDGHPTRVSEVHLLGERDLYRVTFSDKTSVRVTLDHLWHVSTRYGGTRVRSVAEMMDHLVEADGHARYRIPMVAPVEFDERPLPLDPYLIGLLLGDGTFRHQVGLSSADEEIVERAGALLPEGDALTHKGRVDYSIIGGTTRTVLKHLGLFDRMSYEKFVPEDYLWNTAANRLELLHGLMDSDGFIDQRGVVEFHSTSPHLADAVEWLVWSFGGTCSRTVRTTQYKHGGVRKRGREVILVRMALPPSVIPVTLPRKLQRHRPRTTYMPQRRIISIEPAGREEARCLRVEASDHLYVTENFTVTHNTLMAEAVAGETGKPFVFVDPGAFTNMFLGVGILKVKGLFRKLRKLALRYGGVIVFFDEADSLGNRGALTPGPFGGQQPWSHDGSEHLRWLSVETQAALFQVPRRKVDGVIMGGMAGGGGGMGTLQALLSELSGLKKPRGFFNRIVRRALGMQPKPPPKYRIMVMMASNMPQALDEALLRPGRIDRIYKVGYPAKEGRKRTYEGYLAKVRHELDDEAVDKLATITPYATGASIKDLVNEALINAIRNDRESVQWTDVIHAKHLKELGPPEDVEYIQRERHAIAIHEACHAVAAYRTRRHLTIDLATIEKGGTYLGMVSSIKPEDQFTRWRSEYEADIVVSLASLAGERLFFEGDSSSGVSGDLESATTIAMLMEGHWGMGKTVTSHAVTHKVGIAGGGRPGGGGDDERKDLLEGSLGERIETDLVELLARAKDLLTEHRGDVLRLTHALETHKTLSGDDVVAVFEGTEGPLIDGRDYHDPGFTAALETYHRIVVDAHKVHEKVTMALPRLDGDAPDDGEVAAATVS